MDALVLIIILLLALAVVVGLALYNGLVRGRLQVREGWSGVQVQLQRRGDLVPNLVETAKGYAAHERGVFESVTRARSQLQTATTPGEAGQANNALTQALRSLFAVAEAYPDLKANQNFLDLQRQLAETEDKVAYARNFYNAVVMQFNSKVSTIPGVFVAGPFGFHEAEFFAGDDASAALPAVKFS
ncbi:MAG: LemA family protein [Dehalococcoidia bacterium]|nr:LemA family protein [Dehalococcoidia bacterium]